MSDKPSYLGLLNAVSLGESAAHEYLEAWIAVTPNADVKAVLQNVSVREGEHGKAFAKRINELGYTLRVRDNPDHAKRLAIAGSTERTDLEKMEKLGFGQLDTGDKPDIFDGFFKDHSIDIRTGELLGRYIAEERDSGRQLRCCYLALKDAAGTPAGADRVDRLEQQVADLCRSVETLCEMVGAAAAPAPRNGTKGRAKAR
jgi:hypothetical protein